MTIWQTSTEKRPGVPRDHLPPEEGHLIIETRVEVFIIIE